MKAMLCLQAGDRVFLQGMLLWKQGTTGLVISPSVSRVLPADASWRDAIENHVTSAESARFISAYMAKMTVSSDSTINDLL